MTTIRSNPYATSCFPTPNQQPSFQDPRANETAQFDQACRTLAQHFNELDGFNLFGGGTIDVNELYKASMSGSPDVQQAARFLLSRPDLLNQLDTAKHGGTGDGKISLNDLTTQIGRLDRAQAVQQLRYDPRLPELQQSLQALQQYAPLLDTAGGGLFNSPDGKISQKDLDAVITNPNYPPDLRKAAFFFSMNRDLQGLLDTASEGGRADGTISFNDLQALQQQLAGVQPAMPPFQPPYRGGPIY